MNKNKQGVFEASVSLKKIVKIMFQTQNQDSGSEEESRQGDEQK